MSSALHICSSMYSFAYMQPAGANSATTASADPSTGVTRVGGAHRMVAAFENDSRIDRTAEKLAAPHPA
jgi:hypothetical protein